MKNNYLFSLTFILLLLLLIHPLTAESYKVSGYVKMDDGTNLGGILVWIDKQNKKATTDSRGYFSLYLEKKGKYVLMIHSSGFELKMIPIEIKDKDIFIPGIILTVEKIALEMTVTAKIPKIMSSDENIGTVFIEPEELVSLPSLGEPDIFRSLQLLPGINASSESSGLYIRGGKPDQNLILFDGFTIYHVDHFFGIFSAFNSSSIDQIKLFKGGFESKYGGRLSSIMELTGKSGNSDKFSAGAGINFLSANGYVSTPLGKRGSLFLAGRRSFQSPLYTTILDNFNDSGGSGSRDTLQSKGGRSGGKGPWFESEPISYFYDLNGKLTYNISSKDLVTFSFYNGMDNLDNTRDVEEQDFQKEGFSPEDLGYEINVEGEYTDITKWGNTGLSFNWFRNWSNKFTTTATVGYSKYFNERDLNSTMRTTFIVNPDAQLDPKTLEWLEQGKNAGNITYIDNNLTDYTFRLNNTWHLSKRHQVDFGLSITANEINYVYSTAKFRFENDESNENIEPENVLDIHEKGSLYAFYLQDKINLFKDFTITPGIRLSRFDKTEEWFIEPRFAFILNLSKKIKLKGAFGKFYQFANNIVREDILQGDQDFWTLSNGDTIPVSSAIHYIAGISYETKNYIFDIECYYKEMEGLSEFSYRKTLEETDLNYYDYFFTGSGISKGIEFLIQKKFGNLSGWICYTFGEVEYNFPDLSETPFPASHNTTHEFKLVTNYQIKNWNLSATWIYASGRPYTQPLSVIEEIEYIEEFDKPIIRNIVEFGPKNGSNLPDYHRLDLAVTYEFKIGSFKASAGLSFFNVYNQTNVARYEYDVAEEEFIQTDVNYLGFTPSVFIKIFF